MAAMVLVELDILLIMIPLRFLGSIKPAIDRVDELAQSADCTAKVQACTVRSRQAPLSGERQKNRRIDCHIRMTTRQIFVT